MRLVRGLARNRKIPRPERLSTTGGKRRERGPRQCRFASGCSPPGSGSPPRVRSRLAGCARWPPHLRLRARRAGGQPPRALLRGARQPPHAGGDRRCGRRPNYPDQGLMLLYGFDHAEAERSFRAAAALDPQCALRWWGAAYVVGPNINLPMQEDAVPRAWEALGKAIAASPGVTARERAYIEAPSKRCAEEPPEDRKPLHVAYADAMRDLARRYPDDLDAQTLFAEALLNLRPWDWYGKDRPPARGRPSRPHAGPHVLPDRPVPRLRGDRCAGGGSGQSLRRAVPRAGRLPARLRSPQPALRLGLRRQWRARARAPSGWLPLR